jgi:HEAT repeat protein
MNKLSGTEFNNILAGFPENMVVLIRELLDDNNFSNKHNARIALVSMGKNIIPLLHKLLATEYVPLRLEVAKVVQLIADRRSIPKLIVLLNDKEFDIRWIAAEGLVRIGRRSILPLLKAIRDGQSSISLNKGAHHVLTSLLNEKEKEDLNSLLLTLDNYHELSETVPTEAALALKTLHKR